MNKKVSFYFDYASPYAFIANSVLSQYLDIKNVEFKPIYLRGLETFSKAMPFVPNKLRYIMMDLQRCAKEDGLTVKMPSNFPINGLYACRGAVFTLRNGGFEKYHEAVFKAVWVEDRNISDKEVLIDVAVASGQEKAQFIAGIEADGIKEKLKIDTAEAQKEGLFGVPSFVVDGELFWGRDRMNLVRQKMKLL